MVNTITQLFDRGSQWLFHSRKRNTQRPVERFFEVAGHKVPVETIASIRVNKGFVQFNRTQEPTVQVSLKAHSENKQLGATRELVFAGDQADSALDALADCGYLDDIDSRVKKRVFLNARFDYQDDLTNYRTMQSYVDQPTSGVH